MKNFVAENLAKPQVDSGVDRLCRYSDQIDQMYHLLWPDQNTAELSSCKTQMNETIASLKLLFQTET